MRILGDNSKKDSKYFLNKGEETGASYNGAPNVLTSHLSVFTHAVIAILRENQVV